MTKDEIIRMAREAGCHASVITGAICFNPDVLERFAALVAAHEREACAKVCDDIDNNMEASWKRNAVNCAAAIRERSANLCQNSAELVETDSVCARRHRYVGHFGD